MLRSKVQLKAEPFLPFKLQIIKTWPSMMGHQVQTHTHLNIWHILTIRIRSNSPNSKMPITSNNDKLMPTFSTRKIFTVTSWWLSSQIPKKKPTKTWLLKTIISISNMNRCISNHRPSSIQTTRQTHLLTRVYFRAKNVKWLSECFKTVVKRNC
mgnify:CR=1 FL=1